MLLPHSNIKNTVQALKNISLGRNSKTSKTCLKGKKLFHSDVDTKHSGTSVSKY